MKLKKLGLSLVFSIMVIPLLILLFQNFSSTSPEEVCPAAAYTDINNCLLKVLPPDTKLKINILSDIILERNQVIRIKEKQGITLNGAKDGGSGPVIISESLDRLKYNNHNSNYLIEVLDDAKDIRIENINIVDPVLDVDSDLSTKCITINDDKKIGTAEIVDPDMCRPPMLVGGVLTNAERITIDKVSITSAKQFLMAVRKTDGLTILNSQFTGGSVSGVFMQAGYRHFNTIIHHNLFTLAGTAALSISDADNTKVYSNTFVNNHIHPQYTYLDSNGKKALYPGGQLYLGDAKSTELVQVGSITNVRILSNEITMTEPYASSTDFGFPTTAGIEIMNGTNSGIYDVLVQYNKITNLPRSGISVHCPLEEPCFKNDDTLKITVRDNVLYKNLQGFPTLDERYSVNLEKNPHSGANVFLNSLFISGTGYLKANLSESDPSCNVDATTNLCTVTIRASIENRPASSSPVIRVNGSLFKAMGTANLIEVQATWIKKQSYVFSLHLSSAPNEPAIANWNVQGK